MTETGKELATAAGVAVLGGAFLILGLMIPDADDDIVGPRIVPIFLALMLIALAGVLAIFQTVSARPGKPSNTPKQGQPQTDTALTGPALLFRPAAVTAAGFLYISMMDAVGYMLASMISLALLLWLYGNRSVSKLALLSTGGGLAYYLIFVEFMGMSDPPGWLLDASVLF